ncbi:carbohydrate sulfotransferase 9 isoform X3 [Lingula anatina]|uniref:Carbohydrate sulfotransferase n=1 Tax=Lingula anatina TaxID=7574 RepID=A0A1S3I0T0_LINAN|nr:carbohydrate sulfotransferase 9 isoform X3 [Lingula anatina]XP_013391867.1 carbohydrate sulfotransferase 9 isoform X3 [Lingula anatina]|eukprot:XP_013391865.1 carbohydrate sulfotransferase 9 isoform X3 [Lingula anatina]
MEALKKLQWFVFGAVLMSCLQLWLRRKQTGTDLGCSNPPPRIYDRHSSWLNVPKIWREEMERRVKHMETVCRDTTHSVDGSSARTGFPPMLYVDDRHRLIMCSMPKVGCTNGKRLLYALTGNVDMKSFHNFGSGKKVVSYKRFLPRLSQYSPFGAKLRLETYLKVIIVRHPLERLVSAYRGKLEGKGHPITGEAIYIAKRFETNPTPGMLTGKEGVSFQAFIDYLNSLDPNKDYNDHWESYIRLCDPCQIHYDVIARLESQGTDLNMMLKLIGMDDMLTYPEGDLPASSSAVWKKYFTEISRSDIRKIWQHYELDARLFNFTLDWY